PGIAHAVVEAFLSKNDTPEDPLTRRERQVLQLVAEGKTTKETAVILGISAKTVESHRTRLMQKLDIHETAGLVPYAVQSGALLSVHGRDPATRGGPPRDAPRPRACPPRRPLPPPPPPHAGEGGGGRGATGPRPRISPARGRPPARRSPRRRRRSRSPPGRG